MKIEEILNHFSTTHTKQLSDGQFLTCCPAHDDEHPSLYIKEDTVTGNILLSCKFGCSAQEIVEAAGLKMSDLFSNSSYSKPFNTKPFIENEYYYCNEKGVQVGKKIKYRNHDGTKRYNIQRFENGKWVTGLNGTKLPLYNLPAIINEKGTIYIVEGEKDADAMQELGFTATTPPYGANSKWDPSFNKYFKNKDVIIIADNDDAGREHSKKVAMSVYPVANTVKVVPTENIYPSIKEKGDISDIIEEWEAEGAKELLADAIEGEDYFSAPKTKICNNMPAFCFTNKSGGVSVNAALLAEHFKQNEDYLIVKNDMFGNSQFYLYKDGKYSPVSDDEVKAKLIKYITEYDMSVLKMSAVKEALEIIKTDSNFVLASEFDKDEKIINFKNGLLHLNTMELTPHSPEVLSTMQINAEWTDEETPTPVFDEFLDSLASNNEELKRLLITIIGLCISCIPGHRTKKSLFLVGEGNTGKSRLRMLMEKLLGEEFCCSLDLTDLESRFGPSMLLGKRLAGSSDLSFGTARQLKIFKQLVGGDTIVIEKKFQNMSSYRFDGFLWFSSNTMPLFGGDKGKWVYDRFIIVPCTNIVPKHKRDPLIVDKMFEERNGIVQKAVKALKVLIANDYKFDLPKICTDAVNEHKKQNSAAITFFEDCCVMRPEDEVISLSDKYTMTTIRKVFNAWCKDNIGKCPYSTAEFDNEISGYLNLSSNDIKTRTSKSWHYVFTLNEETQRDYLKMI